MEAGKCPPAPSGTVESEETTASSTPADGMVADMGSIQYAITSRPPSPAMHSDPDDVAAERIRVDQEWDHRDPTSHQGLSAVMNQPRPQPAVLLRNLRKLYSPQSGILPVKVAVADLSLMVAQREAFGLLGPNGAGKTTTLRMMQGDSMG